MARLLYFAGDFLPDLYPSVTREMAIAALEEAQQLLSAKT
jgi:hypothetical protein